MITVRYFAAAAEAAGTTTERLAVGSAADVRPALVAAHGAALSRVLPRCTVLVDGTRLPDDATGPLPPDATVDVLPPFAGG